MLIMIVLNACTYPRAYKWKLSRQLNTKWVSEDDTIVFSVDNNHLVTGLMSMGDDSIEIGILCEPEAGAGLHIYPINVLEEEVISTKDQYEYWLCSYKSEKEFIATVKKTTFFEEGEQITFYRVDDE